MIAEKGWGSCGCRDVAHPLARGSGALWRGGKKKKAIVTEGQAAVKGFVTCRGDTAAGHCLAPS